MPAVLVQIHVLNTVFTIIIEISLFAKWVLPFSLDQQSTLPRTHVSSVHPQTSDNLGAQDPYFVSVTVCGEHPSFLL